MTSPINTYQQLVAIAAEECGELTQVCMKHLRKFDASDQIDDKWHNKLVEEAGDVLWNLAVLLKRSNIPLAEVAQYNIDKLTGRAERGTIRGDGGNR